jgi:hypothetical protein
VSALEAIGRREASIFACLCDAVVAPRPPLPPVRATDAAAAFDAGLAHAPRLNRCVLRAALLALELAPLALGFGARLRRLAPPQRAAALARLDRCVPVAPLLKALRGMAHLSYYGDLRVLNELGYDPEAIVARAAALRELERRW